MHNYDKAAPSLEALIAGARALKHSSPVEAMSLAQAAVPLITSDLAQMGVYLQSQPPKVSPTEGTGNMRGIVKRLREKMVLLDELMLIVDAGVEALVDNATRPAAMMESPQGRVARAEENKD